MSLVASTDDYNQAIGVVEMLGSFSGANTDAAPPDHKGWFEWGYGSFGSSTSKTTFPPDSESGEFSKNVTVDKDKTVKFRAKASDETGEATGASSGLFKTYAAAATFPLGLTPGTPGTVTCPVSGSVKPNTSESNGTVTIEFRVQGSVPWSETGVIATVSGSAAVALTGTIGGLTPGTTYEARYKLTRNTENDTIAYSNIGVFTTVGAAATIIGAIVMNASALFLIPTNLTGLIIEAPLPEDVVGQMSVPFILITDRSRIVGALISFNSVIRRSSVIVD